MDPDLLAALRRQYVRPGLSAEDLGADPLAAFGGWLADAVAAADEGLLVEPNAMVLSTVGPDGAPSARTVLLKGLDERGLVLFTNYTSRKAREAAAHPQAVLLFPWHPLGRQVIFEGALARVDRAETEAYFRSRPWSSRIGAWASRQSGVVDRADLDARFAELSARWPEGTDVPVPEFWGGLRLVPHRVEFWQGRADRLHDRIRFRRTEPGGLWTVDRLSP